MSDPSRDYETTIPYNAARFEAVLREAVALSRRVLTGDKVSVGSPGDVPHAYSGKYALAEAQQGVAAATCLGALELRGLRGEALEAAMRWAAEGSEVGLVLTYESSSELLEKAARDVEDPIEVRREERGSGMGAVFWRWCRSCAA